MDISLSKLRGMVKDRDAWHAAVHGVPKRHCSPKESQRATENNLATEHQQRYQVLIPGTLRYYLIGKRVFAVMINLRILRWKCYSELHRALNKITLVFLRRGTHIEDNGKME